MYLGWTFATKFFSALYYPQKIRPQKFIPSTLKVGVSESAIRECWFYLLIFNNWKWMMSCLANFLPLGAWVLRCCPSTVKGYTFSGCPTPRGASLISKIFEKVFDHRWREIKQIYRISRKSPRYMINQIPYWLAVQLPPWTDAKSQFLWIAMHIMNDL